MSSAVAHVISKPDSLNPDPKDPSLKIIRLFSKCQKFNASEKLLINLSPKISDLFRGFS